MTNSKDNKRYGLKIFGAFVFTMFFVIDLILLFKGYLNGNEFVTFFVAIAILSIFGVVFPNIKELSIAGYSIKLREKLVEADKLLEEINSIKEKSIKTHLKILLNTKTRLGYEFNDSRYDDFINLYEEVKSFGRVICKSEFVSCGSNLIAQGIRQLKAHADMEFSKEISTNEDFDELKKENIAIHKDQKSNIELYVNNLKRMHAIIDEIQSKGIE